LAALPSMQKRLDHRETIQAFLINAGTKCAGEVR
jgi:hypothetical protein